LAGVAFNDTLPTGLTVASSSGTVCGGTLTTTNPTGISLSGATIAGGSQCQFSVTVTGAASGSYTNTTGPVSSTNGGTGNQASANLSVGVFITLATTADGNAATLLVSGDGGSTYFASPHTFQWVPGSMQTIVTQSPQGNEGWVSWSDGGAISHTITVPGSSTTITASFAAPTSLGGSFTGKTGASNARVWTATIGNNGPGAALGTQITSFTLAQTSGAACTPVVTTPMPLTVGDIAPASNATAQVTINFTGCPTNANFTVTAALSANNGAAHGVIRRTNQSQ